MLAAPFPAPSKRARDRSADAGFNSSERCREGGSRPLGTGLAFPHFAGKFLAGGLIAGTVAFFGKAGFNPPEVWAYVAAFAELATGVALVLGICTRWAAVGAFGVMAMAVYALQTVKGFGWTWNTGGCEYPVFWGLATLAVAVTAFKRPARPSAVLLRPAVAL